jgi:hypothetical protein
MAIDRSRVLWTLLGYVGSLAALMPLLFLGVVIFGPRSGSSPGAAETFGRLISLVMMVVPPLGACYVWRHTGRSKR